MVRAPVQPPDAVHDVALVLDHVNVTDCPAEIDVALALNDTVGVGVGVGGPTLPPPPPPHPTSSAASGPTNENNRIEREES